MLVAGVHASAEAGDSVVTRAGRLTVVPMETGGTLTTRAGTLRVEKNDDLLPTSSVLLGEHAVFRAEGFVTLYGNYPIGEQDVVLVGVNCGGTACAMGDVLSLLVLEVGKEPRTLTHERFVGWGSGATLERGHLEIDLGWGAGKRKLARYDGKALSISFEDRGRPPLTTDECNEVYELVVACATGSPFDAACKNPEESFSGVFMRLLAWISQHPGFDRRRFTNACVAACNRHEAPPLDDAFRKSLCGTASSVPPPSPGWSAGDPLE
jgi:hypothetical protein